MQGGAQLGIQASAELTALHRAGFPPSQLHTQLEWELTTEWSYFNTISDGIKQCVHTLQDYLVSLSMCSRALSHLFKGKSC